MNLDSETVITSTIESQLSIKHPEWCYFRLQLLVDPEYSNSKSVQLDYVSWKSVILTSLKKLHGLIGESILFDILQLEDQAAIIRIQEQDTQKFYTSVFGLSFNLRTIGLDDVEASVRVLSRANYLIGVIN